MGCGMEEGNKACVHEFKSRFTSQGQYELPSNSALLETGWASHILCYRFGLGVPGMFSQVGTGTERLLREHSAEQKAAETEERPTFSTKESSTAAEELFQSKVWNSTKAVSPSTLQSGIDLKEWSSGSGCSLV